MFTTTGHDTNQRASESISKSDKLEVVDAAECCPVCAVRIVEPVDCI